MDEEVAEQSGEAVATPAGAQAARNPKPGTTPFTWACAVAAILAAAGGGSWWYFSVGPGRTVDTTGVNTGMTRLEVCKVLGDPDDVVTLDGKTAMRYGRTHIWISGRPGRGDVVTEITTGATRPTP
jgi:hypothetical protein